MANTVFKLRRSSVAGKVPNTSTLAIGELALNLTDRKLYSSDGTDVWETGANLTTLTVSTNTTVNNIIASGGIYANGSFGSAGEILASNGTTLYWKTDSDYAANTDAQYIWTNTHSFTNTVTLKAISSNGGLGSAGQVLTSNGTSTYWSTVSGGGGGGFTNGQSISVNNFVVTGAFTANSSNGASGQVLTTNGSGVYWSTVSGGGGTSGSVAEIRQQFTGTGACTTFTVSGGYTPSSLSVYLNGVMLRNGTEVDVTNGSTVIFTTAPANNVLIDVVGRGASFSNNVSTTISQQFTANGTANSFTITGGYIPNEVMVWVNGVKQIPGTDVIVSSGSTVNFPSAVPNNYVVDVFGYATAVLSTSVRQSNTGDGTSNTFTITGGYIPSQLDVYMNGVKIGPSIANVSSGLTVNFTTAPPSGAELQFVGLTPSNFYTLDSAAAYVWTNTQTFANLVMVSTAGISANGSYGANGQVLTSNGTSVYWSNATNKIDELFTGTGACTTFTVTGGYIPSQLDVYVTGVKQVPGTDVTITSGNNIVFAIAPPNNAIIEAVGWVPVTYTYANTSYAYVFSNTQTFGNSTVNTTVNSSLIAIGNTTVNTQIVAGNVYLNGSTLLIGNSTVNVSINGTSLTIANSTSNVSFGSGGTSSTYGVSQNQYLWNSNGNYSGLGFYTSSNLATRQAVLETQIGTATVLKTDGATPLILGTNATERMRIDSSGRVTMPYQPAVHATLGTTHGSSGAGSVTRVVFNTVQLNRGSHYNSGTGYFTCPVAGVYRVTYFGMSQTALADGVFSSVYGYPAKNDTGYGALAYNYGDGYRHISGSWLISCSVNDTLSMYVNDSFGGYNGMTIEFIG